MNLEAAKQEFIKYTNNYDLNNFQIKRKVSHSIRVMQLSESISKNINLKNEDIEVATLIGLLHDIGRFEQMTIYHTFDDRKSIDHGDFGVEILKKDEYIRKYIKEDNYDSLIFTAIRNHNKFRIEENLKEKELLFSKIIRDADKIDIIYQATCISWTNYIEEMENSIINKDIINPFREKRAVNRRKDLINISYPIGHLVTLLGFVFDINYPISFQILKEKNYINMAIDRFNFKNNETKEVLEEIRNIVNTYIDSKQKG